MVIVIVTNNIFCLLSLSPFYKLYLYLLLIY